MIPPVRRQFREKSAVFGLFDAVFALSPPKNSLRTLNPVAQTRPPLKKTPDWLLEWGFS
jgi:hypothetical protein